MSDPDDEPPVEVPITGELDLHTFRPKDVRSLVPEYIDECQRRGIRSLRIIHGKGTGTLRELVHKKLRQHPAVLGFRLGDEQTGGWGATLVSLKGSGDLDQGH